MYCVDILCTRWWTIVAQRTLVITHASFVNTRIIGIVVRTISSLKPISRTSYTVKGTYVEGQGSVFWFQGSVFMGVHNQYIKGDFIIQRCSVAKNVGCFRRSLFVCGFVCQHDNFRTTKHRMMKLNLPQSRISQSFRGVEEKGKGEGMGRKGEGSGKGRWNGARGLGEWEGGKGKWGWRRNGEWMGWMEGNERGRGMGGKRREGWGGRDTPKPTFVTTLLVTVEWPVVCPPRCQMLLWLTNY